MKGETFAIKYKGEPLPETEDVNVVIERLKNTPDEFGERVNAIEAQVS